ncbi:MAG: hypothetical protein KAV00_17725 [Phycisphaerae bacterium]|nr:hypothetical protein [Phycisphaerae bacterium]
MTAMANPHIEAFDSALEGWNDHRFVTRQELRAVTMFSVYLVNLLEGIGFYYYGHTYTQKGRIGCLVVKADREGTPLVVFSNARSYTRSVIVFLRRLDEDTLEWRKDKYR